MLNIIGLKTTKGYYLSISAANGTASSLNLSGFLINGEVPAPTFASGWVFVSSKPQEVQRKGSLQYTNYRYELKYPVLTSEDIPLVLSQDEAGSFDADFAEFLWCARYKSHASLYELKCDEEPAKWESIDFNFDLLLELDIDEIAAPPEFNYTVRGAHEVSTESTFFSSSAVRHQVIDKILTPSILLHNKPCSLSSVQVYKALRQYIKSNIDLHVAQISSDYDFCFSVKKIIALSEPIEKTIEELTRSGKRYKNPRYKKQYIATRTVDVFDMTHTEAMYKGYTPIEGLTAANEYELKTKLLELCEGILAMINEPLVDCPHCCGRGVVLSGGCV